MENEWRFIQTGFQDGATNMAIDEAILIFHSKGLVPPTLRFYGWSPPAFSLGYFQKVERVVDLEKCRLAGVDCVRRITGGRAVFHDKELTYSVIASQRLPQISGRVIESYLKLSKGVLEGLALLGIPAKMVEKPSKKRHTTAACFDAPSWYELVVDGKKLVGSAQTRKFGCVLQHGAILLDLDVDKMFELMAFPNEALRNRQKEIFKKKACTIKSVLGCEVTYEEISQAILTGFKKSLGVKLIPSELTDKELELASKLREEKYSRLDWSSLDSMKIPDLQI
ncbi:biotin/lipoate A/B protein ligase family protein [Kosmotoga sp.]|uniref:lipoate--protein ligase family protein n=1 Tax=Kosmotoga sp. TaxID=1955248 RepID=UPI0024AC4D63|nr:biotin/lipoate A/B protein ligase family protein [Kosmotoga sp.]MDI3523744.1 lipoyl(octanoyl) transferase [Kosmotoga sp.]MDK2953379.1 lipoyl(octanoyl) transferase [Kosmotoga sp.]